MIFDVDHTVGTGPLQRGGNELTDVPVPGRARGQRDQLLGATQR